MGIFSNRIYYWFLWVTFPERDLCYLPYFPCWKMERSRWNEQVCWQRQHDIELASMDHGSPWRLTPELHSLLVPLLASSHLTCLTHPICRMGLIKGTTAKGCCKITYLKSADHGGWYIHHLLRLLLLLQLFLKPNLTLSLLFTRPVHCPLLPPESGWALLSASAFSQVTSLLYSCHPDLPEVSQICHILSDISASYQVTWNECHSPLQNWTLVPEHTPTSLGRSYIKYFLFLFPSRWDYPSPHGTFLSLTKFTSTVLGTELLLKNEIINSKILKTWIPFLPPTSFLLESSAIVV